MTRRAIDRMPRMPKSTPKASGAEPKPQDAPQKEERREDEEKRVNSFDQIKNLLGS